MAKNQVNPYIEAPSVPSEGWVRIADLLPDAFRVAHDSIELEIGFGKGQFLLDRAQANMKTCFIGLETRRKWVHLVKERSVKRDLTNIRAWHGDVRTVLPRILEEACLDRIFINFPDPWWKARHAKRMVISTALVEQIARLLKCLGEVFIQTDVEFRAEHYLKLLSSNPHLKPVSGNGRIKENPFNARSLRETKCEEIGLSIHRMMFSRRERGR